MLGGAGYMVCEVGHDERFWSQDPDLQEIAPLDIG
jgi:hypothetical protein